MKKYLLIILVIYLFNIDNALIAQSPYRTNWKKNSLTLGASVAIAFLAASFDDSIRALTENEINSLSREDINWFDRSASHKYSEEIAGISDIIVASCLLSPLTLFVSQDIRSDFSIVGIMYFETLLLSSFLPSFGKGFERIRPYVYNEDAPLDKKKDPGARRSFYSGHTTWAFASAVFFATVYSDYYSESKWKPYVWGSSLLAASTVGYMRYESGAHYPTDALLGAAVGSAVGYFIPYIYRNKEKNNLSITPKYNSKGVRLAFNYSF